MKNSSLQPAVIDQVQKHLKRSCKQKKPYSSIAAADGAAMDLIKNDPTAKGMGLYQCTFCNHWHITRRVDALLPGQNFIKVVRPESFGPAVQAENGADIPVPANFYDDELASIPLEDQRAYVFQKIEKMQLRAIYKTGVQRRKTEAEMEFWSGYLYALKLTQSAQVVRAHFFNIIRQECGEEVFDSLLALAGKRAELELNA